MKYTTWQTAALAAIGACVIAPGCGRRSESTAEEKPGPPPFQRNEASLAGMVKQERSKIQNDFTNLAIYYRLCADDRNGHGPGKWEELKPYIGNDLPSLVRGIEEGRYVVVWKSPLSSNHIIAYEKQADTKGLHVTLFGDGHILSLSTEELEQKTKAKN
jgi:hypothetical protein